MRRKGYQYETPYTYPPYPRGLPLTDLHFYTYQQFGIASPSYQGQARSQHELVRLRGGIQSYESSRELLYRRIGHLGSSNRHLY